MLVTIEVPAAAGNVREVSVRGTTTPDNWLCPVVSVSGPVSKDEKVRPSVNKVPDCPTAKPLVVGDVVRLKSGGPRMTVTYLACIGKNVVSVEWYENGRMHGDAFPEDSLERLPARLEELQAKLAEQERELRLRAGLGQ